RLGERGGELGSRAHQALSMGAKAARHLVRVLPIGQRGEVGWGRFRALGCRRSRRRADGESHMVGGISVKFGPLGLIWAVKRVGLRSERGEAVRLLCRRGVLA